MTEVSTVCPMTPFQITCLDVRFQIRTMAVSFAFNVDGRDCIQTASMLLRKASAITCDGGLVLDCSHEKYWRKPIQI